MTTDIKTIAGILPKDFPYDLKIVVEILKKMIPTTRREWVIKMIMSQKGQTYDGMARRHRISKAYLAGAIVGRFPWAPKIIKCLEAELSVKVVKLLTATELKKFTVDMKK